MLIGIGSVLVAIFDIRGKRILCRCRIQNELRGFGKRITKYDRDERSGAEVDVIVAYYTIFY